MCNDQLAIFIDGVNNASSRRPNDDDVFQLLLFTNAQGSLMDAVKELHALADQVSFYKTSESVTSTIVAAELPLLMANVMESRERAKRLYRSALSTRICDTCWDFEELYEQLDEELLRTSDMLGLYSRRGSYH